MPVQQSRTRQGREQLAVAFTGPPDAAAHALVTEAGARVVDDLDAADVVHVTRSADAGVETLEGLIDRGRSVVLHQLPVQPEAEAIARLAARAAAAGVVVAVPFVLRYYPMIRLARRRIRSGTPGPLHLVHGWTGIEGLSRWCDLLEFVTRHRVERVVATAQGTPDETDAGDEPTVGFGVLFETDRGAAGTLAMSNSRPMEGGSLVLSLDGVEESVLFHEGRAEVLDVVGIRFSQRFQRAVGAEVSRYSTEPPGHPQGERACWVSYVADAHAAARGSTPDGLPTLTDLARSAALAEAVREAQLTTGWTSVVTPVPDLVTTTEGRTT
ncbi:hypothetical protein [Marmoricola sp. URHB0036]|uniref:hypothetical protein n=1 Tax=Marmoricola sp. URHB0036 TaxID=1298863 RepID=UPI00040960AA|nr:hypothetical protein [Marmoricola sp. URHB0036]